MDATTRPLPDTPPAGDEPEAMVTEPQLTEAEEKRVMAALESVRAGRVQSAEIVRRRLDTLLPT